MIVAPTESTGLQLPRALVASAAAAGIDFGILIVLVQSFHWAPPTAAVLSYCVGGVLQYILCAVWVFPAAPQSVTFGFIAFTVLSLVGLLITWGIMGLTQDIGGIHYTVAKMLALGVAFCWNFLSRKYWLFRRRSV
jgi:putative flippase GtrA